MRPEFQKKEIVFLKPDTEDRVGGGDLKQTIVTILYIGNEVTKYKVGDKILIDMIAANKSITIFGKPLSVINSEDSVTCKIIENE